MFTMQFLIRVLSLKYKAFQCKLAVEDGPLMFDSFWEKKSVYINLTQHSLHACQSQQKLKINTTRNLTQRLLEPYKSFDFLSLSLVCDHVQITGYSAAISDTSRRHHFVTILHFKYGSFQHWTEACQTTWKKMLLVVQCFNCHSASHWY